MPWAVTPFSISGPTGPDTSKPSSTKMTEIRPPTLASLDTCRRSAPIRRLLTEAHRALPAPKRAVNSASANDILQSEPRGDRTHDPRLKSPARVTTAIGASLSDSLRTATISGDQVGEGWGTQRTPVERCAWSVP